MHCRGFGPNATAAAGARVLITRHKRAVAELGPTERQHVDVSSQLGRARIRPLFRARTQGK